MMKELDLRVSLFGKHPSSSEYLYLGENSDFMKSVLKWVEKGYETLLQSRLANKSSDIHHFCFLNKKVDSFICGSVKLSKDNNNRQYPLVIAIEVSPYGSFLNSQEVMEYAKSINEKILEIFNQDCNLEELKMQLLKLSNCKESVSIKEDLVSSIFMNENFSQVNMFFRPLEIDDFIEMMR